MCIYRARPFPTERDSCRPLFRDIDFIEQMSNLRELVMYIVVLLVVVMRASLCHQFFPVTRKIYIFRSQLKSNPYIVRQLCSVN